MLNKNKIKILYAGTLYPNQKIEEFLQLVSELNKIKNIFEIEFIVIEIIPSQINRLNHLKENLNINIVISEKIIKEKLHKKMLCADLFFLTALENVKGWYPVKLFNYAKYQIKNVLNIFLSKYNL